MIALPDASVPEEGLLTWDAQYRQFPKVGRVGVTYETRKLIVAMIQHRPTGAVAAHLTADVECVLHRNSKGHLVGILLYHPVDVFLGDQVIEKAGTVNVFVRPDRRRRGRGSRLIEAALRRWPDLDPTEQQYTEAGRALVEHMIEKGTAR